MSIHPRGGGYIVRWRFNGKQHSKKFDRKRDAQAFEAKQRTLIQSNSFTPPARARITVEALADEWFSTRTVSPRTLHDYQEVWTNLIAPTWSTTRVENIRPDAITSWVSTLAKRFSPARVNKAFTVFKQLLDFAVMGERLESNPATRAKTLAGRGFLPRPLTEKAHRYLTANEVRHLAAQDSTLTTMILTMAYTGLRFGEVTALRVRDVDVLRSRVHVLRAFSEVNGRLVPGPPKSGLAREVPTPRFLRELLQERVTSATSPDDLVFLAKKGGPFRNKTFRRLFDAAVAASGLPRLTPHDLRHTYASLSIHAGVGPKALQEAMGHADIRLTMNTYAGLFEADRNDHADRLDALAREASVEECSPNVPQSGENGQKSWSRLGDLNPGPTHYECVALPLS